MPASPSTDTPYTLVIGDKNLSSWSLRPWLLMRHAGIPFAEVKILLDRADTQDRIREHSAAGKVPILQAGDLTVWDSLAICEYIAEAHPDKALWPANAAARAVARSAVAEMHAGFAVLRKELPMEICGDHPDHRWSQAAADDIARVTGLWRDCRARFGGGGPFLFGAFSVADAMYAPVVTRFLTYGVTLGTVERAYCEAVNGLPAMADWRKGARAEVSPE
jgi:glutathione S-transferase